MKTPKNIEINGFTVSFALKIAPLEKNKPYAVDLIATCLDENREGRVTFHPDHDKSPEDFQRDIDRFAQNLAKETIGHLKAKKALSGI
jgi:hypothetical protein